MTEQVFLRVALDPGLSMLPSRMDSAEARLLILAICQQESHLKARRQFNHGPARGYAQFELSGVKGVLDHKASGLLAAEVCNALNIVPLPSTVHTAIEFNDTLMVALSRLLIWTLPRPLPVIGDLDEAWKQYLALWRPGKPYPEHWPMRYLKAMTALGYEPTP